MRLALFSDIHGNIAAFERATKDMLLRGVDKGVCLGDLVGYGPRPKEVVDYAMHLQDSGFLETIVRGNHDVQAANPHEGVMKALGYNFWAQASLLWSSSKLSDNQREFLVGLPETDEMGSMYFVHGEVEDPFAYVVEGDTNGNHINYREELSRIKEKKINILVVGHSHKPGIYTSDSVQFVIDDNTYKLKKMGSAVLNLGSIGARRDVHNLITYYIHDTDDMSFQKREIEYDYEPVRKDLQAIKIDKFIKDNYPAMIKELHEHYGEAMPENIITCGISKMIFGKSVA